MRRPADNEGEGSRRPVRGRWCRPRRPCRASRRACRAGPCYGVRERPLRERAEAPRPGRDRPHRRGRPRLRRSKRMGSGSTRGAHTSARSPSDSRRAGARRPTSPARPLGLEPVTLWLKTRSALGTRRSTPPRSEDPGTGGRWTRPLRSGTESGVCSPDVSLCVRIFALLLAIVPTIWGIVPVRDRGGLRSQWERRRGDASDPCCADDELAPADAPRERAPVRMAPAGVRAHGGGPWRFAPARPSQCRSPSVARLIPPAPDNRCPCGPMTSGGRHDPRPGTARCALAPWCY